MIDKRIENDLYKSYGIVFTEVNDVFGGYLNKKWKINSNHGRLFVKQFSNERYGIERLHLIEESLQRQIILKKSGIPCPDILLCHNQIIRRLDENINYMVMGFCQGEIKTSDTINAENMYSLGKVCGDMHKYFMQLTKDRQMYDKKSILNKLRDYHTSSKNNISIDANRDYKDTIGRQEKIIHSLSDEFLSLIPIGITHKDFAADNILFCENNVSGILDFDTNDIYYQWQDIGRILLSLVLNNNKLNIEFIKAFIAGYQEHMKINTYQVIIAMRLTWCIESTWWILNEYFEQASLKVSRFRDEIVWLTNHWFELEDMLL